MSAFDAIDTVTISVTYTDFTSYDLTCLAIKEFCHIDFLCSTVCYFLVTVFYVCLVLCYDKDKILFRDKTFISCILLNYSANTNVICYLI